MESHFTITVVESVHSTANGADQAVLGRVDLPTPGTRQDDEGLQLCGWVIGAPLPAIAVEIIRGGDVIGRLEIDEDRPDVASLFPDHPQTNACGFRSAMPILDAEGPEVEVRAVLADGTTARLAAIRLRAVPMLDPGVLHSPPPGEYDLSTEDVVSRYRSSPVVRWGAKAVDGDPPPGSAWARITGEAFFEPLIKPEFQISRDDRVFAIGSCFARGVEGALARLGVPVVSRTDVFDEQPMRAPGKPMGFTNKYNTEAISNELRWALEPGEAFPPEALQQLPGERWLDPHAGSNLEYASRESTVERHRQLTELTRQISDCRIVVITLGLIETFFDTKTGLFTNTTPHLTAEPDRFRFRVLAFDQVMGGLEQAYKLLSSHGHPSFELVVTVSPVPLEATFTGQDVVLANTLSKSVLRAAAGAWSQRHENVHYFPSYEIVMNSDRRTVWHKDGRHVRQSVVDRIMDLFVRTHLADAAEGPRLAAAAG